MIAPVNNNMAVYEDIVDPLALCRCCELRVWVASPEENVAIGMRL
jgi:hypothetical protein